MFQTLDKNHSRMEPSRSRSSRNTIGHLRTNSPEGTPEKVCPLREDSSLFKYSIIVVLVLFAIFSLSNATIARQITVSINGGPAVLTGDGSKFWNPGFDVGLNGFYRVTPHVLCGVRFSYSRWTPDEDELTGNFGYSGIYMNVSGSQAVVEIVPALRLLAPLGEESPFNFFVQAGVGLYLTSEKTTIEAAYAGQTETFEDERSENKVGMSFGAGINIGYFEILPLYTIVATDEESTRYYSINAGAVFSF
jgi:hypothetical protein